VTIKDKCAVVGVGATDYYRRGQSVPQSTMEMAIKATLAALDDAGLTKDDLDGFALYSGAPVDPGAMAKEMGIGQVGFAASLTSGGGGAAGSIGLAAAAINAGMANVVVSLMTLQQAARRLGGSSAGPRQFAQAAGGAYGGGVSVPPATAFSAPAGMGSPGHNFSMVTQRHMHQYGTKREHLAEICINQRNNALTRPKALMKTPLTLDEYFNARMISDPLCLFDYTMESDGAVAVITTSVERAKDLRHPPAVIAGSVAGGHTDNYSLLGWWQQKGNEFASSGHRNVAKQLYEMAGVGPEDIDVACFYDHFSPMVLMQVEDYGLCPIGEGGPFIADGNIRLGGKVPVNTHGGNLSEAYIIGMTHIVECVEQIRGTAINQVEGAEYALCTGGPAVIPMSGSILRKL
jgi:acetyl-CoA acetyltransferase